MAVARSRHLERLPARFEDLVRLMPPRAIVDEVQVDNVIEMIDQLMAADRLSPAQGPYLETLVQLMQFYEERHHAIDLAGVSGLYSLRHLLSWACIPVWDR
jgi:hypothetical protein